MQGGVTRLPWPRQAIHCGICHWLPVLTPSWLASPICARRFAWVLSAFHKHMPRAAAKSSLELVAFLESGTDHEWRTVLSAR